MVWFIFVPRRDDRIQPAHPGLAKVSNLPNGQILPRICTPLNKATSPSPGKIRPHLNTQTSPMVLRWSFHGGFVLLHPRLHRRAWADDDVVHRIHGVNKERVFSLLAGVVGCALHLCFLMLQEIIFCDFCVRCVYFFNVAGNILWIRIRQEEEQRRLAGILLV